MQSQTVEIILVEDNEHDADLTIRALRKENLGNHLIHLEDGEQALDFLFARGAYAGRQGLALPKVILLDIKMPKVDGIEVLRQVRANEETKRIPVVIMTSSAQEKDLVASYELGVNSYVVKPVQFEDFQKAVSQLGLYWLLANKVPDSMG